MQRRWMQLRPVPSPNPFADEMSPKIGRSCWVANAIYTTQDGKAWQKDTRRRGANSARPPIRAAKNLPLRGEGHVQLPPTVLLGKPSASRLPCSVCWSNGSPFIGTSQIGRAAHRRPEMDPHRSAQAGAGH